MRRYPAVVIVAAVVCLLAAPAFAASDIIRMNKDIEVSGDMAANDVVAIGGNIIVFGRVEQNVVAVGGSVILKPGSYVGQQVVVVGGRLIRDPAAEVAGRITEVDLPHFIPSGATLLKGGWMALWAALGILALFGFLGLSILLAALIPEHIAAAVNALEGSFLLMVMWGILWMLLVVPIAVLLAISIIGIILIPLEIILVALAFLIGYIVSAIYVGRSIFLAFKKVPPPMIDAIIGILVLFLAGLVPIAGSVIGAIFLAAGFGAVITTRFGTIRK